MNGFGGTAGAETDFGPAGAPANAGAAARSDGLCGIGIAATPSARAPGVASSSPNRTRPSTTANRAWSCPLCASGRPDSLSPIAAEVVTRFFRAQADEQTARAQGHGWCRTSAAGARLVGCDGFRSHRLAACVPPGTSSCLYEKPLQAVLPGPEPRFRAVKLPAPVP